MISRRSAAVVLCLLAFAGCHEDPTVVEVTVQPTVEVLGLFADGGAASSAAGTDGTGGSGGIMSITASGLVSLGSPAFVPTAPVTPTVPTILTPSILTGQGDLTQTGSILVSGSVITSNTATVKYESTSGDIVVSGALQSGTLAGAMTAITLKALNGTVYVTGSVVTAGPDSAGNGQSAGSLTIQAARVVITGTLDTHGVANTTIPGQSAGNGGTLTITTGVGPIFITGGSIYTAGGACVDTGAVGGIHGGNGGFVQLNSGTEVNSVYVFAPITADGGTMNGPAATPTGGIGGDIVIRGLNDINIVANLSSLGGSSSGGGADALGGAGGNVTIDGHATARIYGLLDLGGGFASASGSAGMVTGGNGGSLKVGQSGAPNSVVNSVELGQGTYSMLGGAGQNTAGQGGGPGGAVTVASVDGDVTIGSSLTATGGAGTGAGNASGGKGGSISIVTDQQPSRLSNHVLSVASLASLLDVGGGIAAGTGVGGTGGTVLLQCAGDLTSGARINASGGAAVIGTGGDTTSSAITLSITGAGAITPTGEMSVTGSLLAQGGVNSGGGAKGGAGSSILIQIAGGNGSLTCSATLNTTGGSDTIGDGGLSGNVTIATTGGDINLSGSVTVDGSTSPTTAQNAGTISISGFGAITCTAALSAVGGTSTDPLGFKPGAMGNAVLFNAQGTFGGITLDGATVAADGGATTSGGQGGNAGSITFHSLGQAIDLRGNLTARGGAAGGAGVGGTGGQLIASSDFGNSGTGGNITIEAGSSIDMSGGSGSVQGPALQIAGAPPTDPGPTITLPINLAVIFDTDGNLGTSNPANPNRGQISNLGTITATGSTGGDVWYNGVNSLGNNLSNLDGVGLNITGTSPGRFYFH
jgi:hypothetical protein